MLAESYAGMNASTNDSISAPTGSGQEECGQGLLDKEEYVYMALMSVFGLLGIVGNSLMIAVFVKRLRHAKSNVRGNQYNYFTAALAFADLFVCAAVVPYKTAYSMKAIRDEILCKSMQYAAGVTLIFSVLVLIGIAIERYFAVCRPTTAFGKRHAWIIIGVITGLAFVGSFPNIITSSVYDANDGRPVGCSFASGSKSGRIYAGVLAPTFCLTLLITMVLYSLVFHAIYKRTKSKERLKMISQPRPSDDSSTGSQAYTETTDTKSVLCKKKPPQLAQLTADEHQSSPSGGRSVRTKSSARVVWMLFGVTFIFFISWIPYWLTSLRVIPCSLCLKYLYYINNCTNFIVYGMCNKRIRQEMLDRLLCR